jgi:release factor glutamine methyltransferase
VTFGRALREAAARLVAAGVPESELEARILACEAFGLDAARLIALSAAEAPAGAADSLARLVSRRLAGEPVDRILGRREFWGLEFRLSPETLAPRQDTETVVEAALSTLGGRQRRLSILDLGVGSGCLLLALLSELPNATGVGVDRSTGAAAAAKANAERLGLAARARFIVGDWASSLTSTFDLVVSNPPYIPSAEIETLEVEVREHDPVRALDGGADGLAAYRAILTDLPRLLAPGGVAVLEFGIHQAEDVAALAERAGLRPELPCRNDLSGIPRAAILRAG